MLCITLLCVAKINMPCSLIKQLILYKFEMVSNAAKATKNICYVKVEIWTQ